MSVATRPPEHDASAQTEPPRAHLGDSRAAPGGELALERPPRPEVADARTEEASDTAPPGRDCSAEQRQCDADVALPGSPSQRASRDREVEHGDGPAGTQRRAEASISALWSPPTTRQPKGRVRSIATAAVPVATSRTVSPGPASIRETRKERHRGSCPKLRSHA